MEGIEILKEVTILLVEDDKYARKAYMDMLKRRAKDVYGASDGAEGLEFYEQYAPDLVITDLEMPVVSGQELTRRIKEKNSKKPVVVVTAFSDEASLVEEADAILIKPINKEELFSRLIEQARIVLGKE